ncbi:hypothetical protein N7495_005458 [Penicillium taxi]|uniref:uncharacterized protein n=1 Tax=Penicillium taxi TaxID=168475 RepID=UPI00254529D6|nr:uncharacterized protein N7495_005458 [Penicillium taxi]KAJ5893767.1 hypothetical protein N7495_005458 [Penicillium taxi]
MVVSFFTLPVITSSFLVFTPSKPNTPATGNSRRNSAHAQTQPVRGNDLLASWGINGHHDDKKRKKKIYARSMVEAHDLPVSVNERRDFEGVGGWRPYTNASRPELRGTKSLRGRDSRSTSTSSVYSTNIDDDDHAWLSLNQRLELPSQVVTIGGSNNPENVESLHNFRFHDLTPTSSHVYHTQTPHKHHHRSHTTSSLNTNNQGTSPSLSIAVSNRPDCKGLSHPTSPVAFRAPFITPQPQSQAQTRPHAQNLCPSQYNSHMSCSLDGVSSSFGNGSNSGYFAHPDSALFAVESPSSSPCTTPDTATSNEDRDASPLQITRLMAHYFTSVRSRRSSISGPHYKDVDNHERTR